MPTPLTDADKVLRNDTGKDIVTQLTAIKTAIENGGGGSGASTVSQLTDVLLSQNIPDGDVLVRDNNLTGGKLWKNATITVELTQAEYDQLVADDDVLPDVDYYITDAPSMQGSSKDLSYDGTTLSTYDKIEGLNASNLPIESGIATNTKDYIDTDRHELLWTNTAHTSDFSAQTITPDTKGYSHFIIYTKAFKNNTFLHGNYCIMGETNQINNIGGTNGGYSGDLEIATRTVAIATNSFTFTQSATSTNGSTTSLDNTHCIPYKIFGIK